MRRFLSPRICMTLLVPAVVCGAFSLPGHAACVGDCDDSGAVTVHELVIMTNIALGADPVSTCESGDGDRSGGITVDEIISGLNNTLEVCPPAATPTPTPTVTPSPTPTPSPTSPPLLTPTFSLASTFPQIQATIFNPTCLDMFCHTAADKAGGLILEASVSYANLAGPPPPTPSYLQASRAGMLRVDPGNPTNSLLLAKLAMSSGFDVKFGGRMPLSKPVLSAEQIDNIRAWILRGALADESPPAE